jgi:hypothetical protein
VWLINRPRRQDAWDAVGTASVCVRLVFVSELRGPLLHRGKFKFSFCLKTASKQSFVYIRTSL